MTAPRVWETWVVCLSAWLGLAGCRTPSVLDRAAELDTTPIAREGRVVLECNPTDAEVALDGVPVGRCSDYAQQDHGLETGAGSHRLRISSAGHIPYEAEVAPDRAQTVVHAELLSIKKLGGSSP